MFLAGMILALLLCIPIGSEASVKSFRGEISLEQGYETNPDRVQENEVYESTSSITPRMIFSRSTQKSNLSMEYAPSLIYSYKIEKERVDHEASAAYDIFLTRRISWDIENFFVQTDNPYRYTDATDTGDGGIELSDRVGRRRHWINTATTSISSEYARESFLNLGYTNQVLRNRDDAFTDFIRHSPFASILHRFSPRWELLSEYTFTRGEFEREAEREDVRKTHDGDLALYYDPSPISRLFIHGGYLQTESERAGAEDYTVYTASVGIERDLSPSRSIDLESGISWIRLDDDENTDTEVFYLRAGIDSLMERGSWRVYGESGTDERYYGGIDDEGFSRYWSAGAVVRRNLTRNLAGSAEVSYREDRYLERVQGSEKERRSVAGAFFSYSLGRFYAIFVGYSYTDLDADREGDSYDNHRAFIRFSAGKELLRW